MWEVKSMLGTKQSWLRFKLLPSRYSQTENLVSVRAQIWAALACTRGRSCSFLLQHQLQIPSQCHVLGTGRRGLFVLPGLFFPSSLWLWPPLKAGEIPRHAASLPASPPFFFSVLRRNAELLSRTNRWYSIFFPKNIITRAREASQLESAFSASVRTLFWVRSSESTFENNRLTVIGAFL